MEDGSTVFSHFLQVPCAPVVAAAAIPGATTSHRDTPDVGVTHVQLRPPGGSRYRAIRIPEGVYAGQALHQHARNQPGKGSREEDRRPETAASRDHETLTASLETMIHIASIDNSPRA